MKAIRLFPVLLSLLGCATHAQNLLANGGFEIPAQPAGFIDGFWAGSAALTGWTIGGTGSMFLVPTPMFLGSTFAASAGRQFISFNGNDVKLSQSFKTVARASYEVSFTPGFYQGRTNMSVTAEVHSPNGALLAAQTTPVTPVVGWDPPSRFRFTAATNAATLQFTSSNATPNVDLLMDAVSVEPVTPPLSIVCSQVQLCWHSQTGRLYQLQYLTNLATGAWVDLGAPSPGNGSNICTPQVVGEPQRFFRVILLP